MAQHHAIVEWHRNGAVFIDNRYSREHHWEFDGGIRVRASASPHVVPLPYAVADAVDPEEAFVAALSSCHMLWFLSIAAQRGYLVDRYHDEAVGIMGRGDDGKLAMLEVRLHPAVTFQGDSRPDEADVLHLHHAAHAECFLANSVKTQVHCEPRPMQIQIVR